MTTINMIQKDPQTGIVVIKMESDQLKVMVTNFGCHLISVLMPDKKGHFGDVVLGFSDLETYQKQDKFIGAIAGRVANRIKHGEFSLNGKDYHLAINNGPNHLHGGLVGFDKKTFDYKIEGDKVIFHYLSKDMEEGYPGNLDLSITYELIEDTLTMHAHAVSDQDTLINITNHSYFNLSDETERIDQHELMVKADEIACIDQDGLPDGQFLKVKGTPFDFNEFHLIGEGLKQSHSQLALGKGYDHPFMLSQPQDQICLRHPRSGRKLSISTNLPCVQVYTANYLDETLIGKKGHPYKAREGICLETQYMPDEIHLAKEPKVILRKGESYDAVTSYRFEVEK